MFKELGSLFGEVVGTIAGIAVAPVAIALGVTEAAVKSAIAAGCTTVEEIKEFLNVD